MQGVSVNYYDEIKSACSLALDGTRELDSLFGEFSPSKLSSTLNRQGERAEKMYALSRSLGNMLYDDFITPIEREDIVCIISAAVSLSDSVGEVLREMRVWGIGRGFGDAIEFSDLAKRCTLKISHIASELERFRKKPNIIRSIRDVSEMARGREKLYVDAMSALIKRTTSPSELVAWSGVYSRLDELLSRCAYLADAFGVAVIKNI